jgi:hypothetical protein
VAEDVIQAGTVFREDVRSALPYIETVTQNKYGYEGILIDEERILGLEMRSLFFFALVPIRTPCGGDFIISQTSKDDEIETVSFDVHVLG